MVKNQLYVVEGKWKKPRNDTWEPLNYGPYFMRRDALTTKIILTTENQKIDYRVKKYLREEK